MTDITGYIPELIEKAFDMRKFSYAPYSHFRVGAALLSEKGVIYGGCNIENAAYGPSNCAERTAFFKAISEGEHDFTAIAIAGGAEDASEFGYCAPCGVCRQVMAEFCNPESFKIILPINAEDYKIFTLKELFPESFSSQNLIKT